MIEQLLPRLSSNARALLAQERQELALPAEAGLRQRLLERAQAALEAGRPSGVALRLAGATEAARVGRLRLRRSVLLIAAAMAIAGLAAAGAGMFEQRAAEAPATRHALPLSSSAVIDLAPLPRAVTATEAPPAEAPPVVEAPPAEAHQAPVAPAEGARAANASTYALELQLLEPARSSIARGGFEAALTAIARHQREYPHGQLAEEREALRVRALWGSGQKAAAESAAAAFRKHYPRSGLLGWMKTASTPE
jgi:hypothetical protein